MDERTGRIPGGPKFSGAAVTFLVVASIAVGTIVGFLVRGSGSTKASPTADTATTPVLTFPTITVPPTTTPHDAWVSYRPGAEQALQELLRELHVASTGIQSQCDDAEAVSSGPQGTLEGAPDSLFTNIALQADSGLFGALFACQAGDRPSIPAEVGRATRHFNELKARIAQLNAGQ